MCSRIFFVSVVAMNVRMKSGSSGMAGTFWVSIIATFVGVLFLCRTDGAHTMQWRGLALSFASALSRQSLWGQLLSARALR